MSLLDALKSWAIGSPPAGKSRTIDTGGTYGVHPPMDPGAVARSNAAIAADGANMFQQAHPGMAYQVGQNGESFQGGIDQPVYQSRVQAPLPAQPPVPAGQSSMSTPIARMVFNLSQQHRKQF